MIRRLLDWFRHRPAFHAPPAPDGELTPNTQEVEALRVALDAERRRLALLQTQIAILKMRSRQHNGGGT